MHPYVEKLINENIVFKQYQVNKDKNKDRKQLPFLSEYKEKNKIWQFLKENIGKDLSQISTPVTLNEPLNFLQLCAEQLEYQDFFRKANRTEDQYLRLLYVATGFYLKFGNNIKRLNKPFNPLLNETFEFVENDLFFVAEQVSHHPPVSAFYSECEDFVLEGCLEVRLSFSINQFKVNLYGETKLTLKSTKEEFSMTPPSSHIYNFLVGSAYFWYQGEFYCINQTTKDKVCINFQNKIKNSDNDFEVKGFVYTNKEQKIYEIKGKWKENVIVNKVGQKLELELGRRFDYPQDANMQYFFTKFAIKLNHLNFSMLETLAPTDSRLRPDQRAYEYGDNNMAQKEKLRLEQKQRQRKKMNDQFKIKSKPLWFDFEVINGIPKCRYQGKYFKCKENNDWPENIPDLFNL